jgi:hypothetical protein
MLSGLLSLLLIMQREYFQSLVFFNMMEEQCPLWRLHDTCVDVSLVSKSAVKCNIVWF